MQEQLSLVELVENNKEGKISDEQLGQHVFQLLMASLSSEYGRLVDLACTLRMAYSRAANQLIEEVKKKIKFVGLDHMEREAVAAVVATLARPNQFLQVNSHLSWEFLIAQNKDILNFLNKVDNDEIEARQRAINRERLELDMSLPMLFQPALKRSSTLSLAAALPSVVTASLDIIVDSVANKRVGQKIFRVRSSARPERCHAWYAEVSFPPRFQISELKSWAHRAAMEIINSVDLIIVDDLTRMLGEEIADMMVALQAWRKLADDWGAGLIVGVPGSLLMEKTADIFRTSTVCLRASVARRDRGDVSDWVISFDGSPTTFTMSQDPSCYVSVVPPRAIDQMEAGE